MPTLLVQKKMHPELRARIRATLKRKSAGGNAQRLIDAPTAIAILRVLTVASIVALGTALFLVRKRAQQRFDKKRDEVLAALHEKTNVLTDEDRQTIPRVEAFVARFADAYEG